MEAQATRATITVDVDAMNSFKTQLGSDHPDTLTTIGNLASTYRNQGRLEAAEKLEVDVMNERKLGSDHPDTLTSMANLAIIYWRQSRLDEAHSLLFHAVKTMQQVTGPQHPTVLYYNEQLARLLKEKDHKQCQEMVPLVCHSYWPQSSA